MDLDEYRAKFNEKGEEIMDATPVAHSMKIRPISQFQRIRALIQFELSQKAQQSGLETFEEANDFNVGDDFDPTTPYEEQFDPETGVGQFEFQQERPIDQKEPKTKGKKGDGEQAPHADPNPPVDPNPDE